MLRQLWRIGLWRLITLVDTVLSVDKMRLDSTLRLLSVAPLRALVPTVQIDNVTPVLDGVPVSNPSLSTVENGEIIGVGTAVNHRWSGLGKAQVVGGASSVTQSRLVKFSISRDFSVRGVCALDWSESDGSNFHADARLMRLPSQNGVWTHSVSYAVVGPRWNNTKHRIACRLTNPATSEFGPEVLLESESQSLEKNWVPVEHLGKGRLAFLYSPAGGEPAKSTPEVDERVEFIEVDNPNNLNVAELRGGTPVLQICDALFVSVVHRTLFHPFRNYVHYFMTYRLVENKLQLLKKSPPFNFISCLDIEFCSGMTMRGDHIYLGFGYRNCESWVASIPLTDFRAFTGT